MEGSEHPISVLPGAAACYLLYMLTAAHLMTSSHSSGPKGRVSRYGKAIRGKQTPAAHTGPPAHPPHPSALDVFPCAGVAYMLSGTVGLLGGTAGCLLSMRLPFCARCSTHAAHRPDVSGFGLGVSALFCCVC